MSDSKSAVRSINQDLVASDVSCQSNTTTYRYGDCYDMGFETFAAKRIFGRTAAILACAGVLLVSCSQGGRDVSSAGIESGLDMADSIDPEILRMPADPKILRMRRLLAEQIGANAVERVDELVADHLGTIFPHVKYRTHKDQVEALDLRSMEGHLPSSTEQRDILFDTTVQLALYAADDSRSGDISETGGLMQSAFDASLAECARDAGIKASSRLRVE